MADDLRDDVLACAERTLRGTQVRVTLKREFDFSMRERPSMSRRRGGLLRPVGKVVRAGATAAGKAAWRHWAEGEDFGHLDGEGIVEPAARRHMVDFGSFAELYKDGRQWNGPSGKPLATTDPWPTDSGLDLWFLLDALLGTAAAEPEAEETLHGAHCRRVSARVDLVRAAERTAESPRVPSVNRFDQLRSLPITVWIDDRHVRRVRFREGDEVSMTLTLDLVDFDPAADDLDWDRLPTFRTPEEAL
jgi:hypothetical protein